MERICHFTRDSGASTARWAVEEMYCKRGIVALHADAGELLPDIGDANVNPPASAALTVTDDSILSAAKFRRWEGYRRHQCGFCKFRLSRPISRFYGALPPKCCRLLCLADAFLGWPRNIRIENRSCGQRGGGGVLLSGVDCCAQSSFQEGLRIFERRRAPAGKEVRSDVPSVEDANDA